MSKLHILEQQNIDIRPLEKTDIDLLVKNFTPVESNTQETLAKWQQYYKQHTAGERFVCLITKDDLIIGYGSLLPESAYAPFEQDDVYEIHDLWIAPAHRRQGLATLLISYFESVALEDDADYIGMGVGVDVRYAPAQNLAIRMGYMPDGQGLTYKGVPVVPGKSYPVDDELLVWFVKELENS